MSATRIILSVIVLTMLSTPSQAMTADVAPHRLQWQQIPGLQVTRAENNTIGGASQTALKKLYGARFSTPALLIALIQPIGRGATSALNGLWAMPWLRCSFGSSRE